MTAASPRTRHPAPSPPTAPAGAAPCPAPPRPLPRSRPPPRRPPGLPTADDAVAHTLLNCLLREVSGPEHQTAVRRRPAAAAAAPQRGAAAGGPAPHVADRRAPVHRAGQRAARRRLGRGRLARSRRAHPTRAVAAHRGAQRRVPGRRSPPATRAVTARSPAAGSASGRGGIPDAGSPPTWPPSSPCSSATGSTPPPRPAPAAPPPGPRTPPRPAPASRCASSRYARTSSPRRPRTPGRWRRWTGQRAGPRRLPAAARPPLAVRHARAPPGAARGPRPRRLLDLGPADRPFAADRLGTHPVRRRDVPEVQPERAHHQLRAQERLLRAVRRGRPDPAAGAGLRPTSPPASPAPRCCASPVTAASRSGPDGTPDRLCSKASA